MTHLTPSEAIQHALDTFEDPYTLTHLDPKTHKATVRPPVKHFEEQVEIALNDNAKAEVPDWDDEDSEMGPGTPTYQSAEEAVWTWKIAAPDGEVLPIDHEEMVREVLDDNGHTEVKPVFILGVEPADLIPYYRLAKFERFANDMAD